MQNIQQFLSYGMKLFPFMALLYFVRNEKVLALFSTINTWWRED